MNVLSIPHNPLHLYGNAVCLSGAGSAVAQAAVASGGGAIAALTPSIFAQVPPNTRFFRGGVRCHRLMRAYQLCSPPECRVNAVWLAGEEVSLILVADEENISFAPPQGFIRETVLRRYFCGRPYVLLGETLEYQNGRSVEKANAAFLSAPSCLAYFER